jgi:hypothetical protein
MYPTPARALINRKRTPGAAATAAAAAPLNAAALALALAAPVFGRLPPPLPAPSSGVTRGGDRGDVGRARRAASRRRARRALFLLAATPSNNFIHGYPATLYTISAGRGLVFYRRIAHAPGGVYEVLDDMHGHLFVAHPQVRPTVLTVIHERRPWAADSVVFNPRGDIPWHNDVVTATTPGGQSFALFPLTHGIPKGVLPSTAALLSRATLVAVAADRPAQGPRVLRNRWGLYRDLRFYGNVMYLESFFSPRAAVTGGQIVQNLGGAAVGLGPAPPAVARGAPMVLLAASPEYLILRRAYPRAGLWVFQRGRHRWLRPPLRDTAGGVRLFGAWLAATAIHTLRAAAKVDLNPGHWEERRWGTVALPDVWRLYQDDAGHMAIPGRLRLVDLADGRRIVICTQQEDSEILDVRKDGLVLYRVNDEIFRARIEGDKLSAPKLVVKGDDVPEVHWVFWSSAPPRPPAAAAPPARKH